MSPFITKQNISFYYQAKCLLLLPSKSLLLLTKQNVSFYYQAKCLLLLPSKMSPFITKQNVSFYYQAAKLKMVTMPQAVTIHILLPVTPLIRYKEVV